jgi:hypothetical protein
MPAVSPCRTRLLPHFETSAIASDILKARIVSIQPPSLFYTRHHQCNNRNTTGIELKSCCPHVANVCREFQVCRRQRIAEKGELYTLFRLRLCVQRFVAERKCCNSFAVGPARSDQIKSDKFLPEQKVTIPLQNRASKINQKGCIFFTLATIT